MNIAEHMMGILISATAFAGLTGITINQISDKLRGNDKYHIQPILIGSCLASIFAVLAVLAWFITPETKESFIIWALANFGFVLQLVLFWYGSVRYWLLD